MDVGALLYYRGGMSLVWKKFVELVHIRLESLLDESTESVE